MTIRAAPLFLALSLTGCITFTWRQRASFEPVPDSALQQLEIDESDMTFVLDAFGAPLEVWEYQADGVALAYGWFQSRKFELSAKYVGEDYASGLDHDSEDADSDGIVLFFDRDWILRAWRKGKLRDLREAGNRRPAFVERRDVEEE